MSQQVNSTWKARRIGSRLKKERSLAKKERSERNTSSFFNLTSSASSVMATLPSPSAASEDSTDVGNATTPPAITATDVPATPVTPKIKVKQNLEIVKAESGQVAYSQETISDDVESGDLQSEGKSINHRTAYDEDEVKNGIIFNDGHEAAEKSRPEHLISEYAVSAVPDEDDDNKSEIIIDSPQREDDGVIDDDSSIVIREYPRNEVITLSDSSSTTVLLETQKIQAESTPDVTGDNIIRHSRKRDASFSKDFSDSVSPRTPESSNSPSQPLEDHMEMLLKRAAKKRNMADLFTVTVSINPEGLPIEEGKQFTEQSSSTLDNVFKQYQNFVADSVAEIAGGIEVETPELVFVNFNTGRLVEPFSSLLTQGVTRSRNHLELLAMLKESANDYLEKVKLGSETLDAKVSLELDDSDPIMNIPNESTAATFSLKIQARDNSLVQVRVTAETSIDKVISHYRKERHIPDDKRVILLFDDEQLSGKIGDNDEIEDDMILEAVVK